MPEGVINCTRPGPFGNPIKIGMRPCDVIPGIYDDQPIETMRECWEWFHQVMIDPCQWEKMIGVMPDWAPPIIDRIHELKGKDLACWCRLDSKCHVDTLLSLANTPPETADE